MNEQKRELTQKPACPFCGLLLERPREMAARRPGDMPVGSCACGAVYAYDATGHNLGAAFEEALVFACNMDWDLAWGLLPEEDYRESLIEKYDLETNQIIPGGFYEGRRIAGALYLIRLHDDIREVTARGVKEKLKKAGEARFVPAGSANAENGASSPAPLSKQAVQVLVAEYRTAELLARAGRDKKLLRHLQRLLYAGDELLRLRAAEIMGLVCAVVARKEPQTVTRLLQGLSESVADSAASSWGAVDALGEIISRAAQLYAGYIPVLYQYLADEALRPRALAAIGKIAAVNPRLIQKPVYGFIACLDDPNPENRACAAWILGSLKSAAAGEKLKQLCADEQEINFYQHGRMEKKTVGRLAREALEKI
ncbi:DVU0298 family protein [Desulfotomaculum copahuensis]|uniref:PBS lyase n=1 Tax=Desulfotomaculum copahuensis TaxID=1838280 RepID=A0A1B7LD23_9FIRM|nr:DVU0298 family protein [Desulfotomaculum copahuensis]OAT80836.1 PBS lyase [Desulfotomaculum copahuensis]